MIRTYVIEDEALLRDFVVAFFEECPGFELIGTTDDGRIGLAQCLKLKPELVILDIMLPRLNGVQILSELKKELPKTRVLGYSSTHNEDVYKRMMKLRIDGFCMKGGGLQELKTAIEKVCSGECYFSPGVHQYLKELALTPDYVDSLKDLTSKEIEILQLIAEGQTNKDIANMLSNSPKTIETHRANLMRKLNLKNTADVTRYAIEQGLISKGFKNEYN